MLTCPTCHTKYYLEKKLLSEEKLKAIESFFSLAKQSAKQAIKGIAGKDAKNAKWNEAFHAKMNELAKSDGLRV